MTVDLSPEKRAAALSVAAALQPGRRICLTTHINPDGDGLGSEAGLARLLRAQGLDVCVANPSPTPARFAFLFDGLDGVDRSAHAVKELRRADVVVVLDISDLGRLGTLGPEVLARGVPVVCIDHHQAGGEVPPGPRYVDTTAAATGELVWEIASANGWALDAESARALYVAIMTDTGGFRFSNTHPRTLRVAAELLETGINPERIYQDVYANVPEGRVRMLAEVLETLVVEPGPGLAWLTLPPGALERYDLTADDLDGVVEYPRSIRGVRMAILFRPLAGGRIKASLRSIGDVDVAAFARPFGGGGHTKAAGVALAGELAEVQATLLEAARAYLSGGGAGDGARAAPDGT